MYQIQAVVRCEQPHRQLYEFRGNIRIGTKEKIIDNPITDAGIDGTDDDGLTPLGDKQLLMRVGTSNNFLSNFYLQNRVSQFVTQSLPTRLSSTPEKKQNLHSTKYLLLQKCQQLKNTWTKSRSWFFHTTSSRSSLGPSSARFTSGNWLSGTFR